MTQHARGPFDVKTIPQPPEPHSETPSIGRFLLDKQFHGDLEGTSKGIMLSAGDPRSGSAGYVAIEVVTGKLNGHTGTFAMQHFGTMDAGSLSLEVQVVPGSSSGELKGISGKMTIQIADGKHSYDLEYSLPATQ
ncbi:DUF3224 domain-containing protein [Acidicapsa ligni]|uniref:DUF3224 domain-containing protein n=1 Tax=Acidicapsa ligni TaxID=542300 RepID=UPI0021DFF691|nr:DUF3224 domain-containing protein [Acidicapsa ligni]